MIDLNEFFPIKEFENYSINRNGVIISASGHQMKYWKNHNGYLKVSLTSLTGAKHNRFVHKLIGIQFLDKSVDVCNAELLNAVIQIDHIDGNNNNNALSNLEWVTREENIRRKHERMINLNGYRVYSKGHRKQTTQKNRASRIITQELLALIRRTFEITPKSSHSEIIKLMASAYEMSAQNIRAIKNYKTWNC